MVLVRVDGDLEMADRLPEFLLLLLDLGEQIPHLRITRLDLRRVQRLDTRRRIVLLFIQLLCFFQVGGRAFFG